MHDPLAPLSPDTKAIIAALRETKDDTNRQIGLILEAQRKLQTEVSGIAKGFPDGDPDSHRRYHESVMEWSELRNKMIREALVKAAQVGGVGAIGWILYALYMAAKMEILK